MRDVINYPDEPWQWSYLSKNPSITINDVMMHQTKPWDWNYLNANPNIAMKDARKDNIQDWKRLSSNPGITAEDVIACSAEWCWGVLSRNLFEFSPEARLSTIHKVKQFRIYSCHKWNMNAKRILHIHTDLCTDLIHVIMDEKVDIIKNSDKDELKDEPDETGELIYSIRGRDRDKPSGDEDSESESEEESEEESDFDSDEDND